MVLPAPTLRLHTTSAGCALLRQCSAKIDRFRRCFLRGLTLQRVCYRCRRLAGGSYGCDLLICRLRLLKRGCLGGIHNTRRKTSSAFSGTGRVAGGMTTAEIARGSEHGDQGRKSNGSARQVIDALMFGLANTAKTSACKKRPFRPFNFLAAAAAKIRFVKHSHDYESSMRGARLSPESG